jgi:hypothetical protein
MTPTDTVAHWIALAILILGPLVWLCWKLKWRRDDRAANLAAGIADEQRTALMDHHEGTWRPAAPGDTPGQLAPGEDDTVDLTEPTATLREQLIPVGMVLFLGGAVHVDCVGPLLLNDTPPCAGCAVHLDHVLTGAS